MRFFELRITIKLANDLSYEKSPEFLSANLHRAMLQDEQLKEIHKQKFLKPYSLSFLVAESGSFDFSAGENLFFNIRSFDENLLHRFCYAIEHCQKLDFEVISTKIMPVNVGYVNGIYSMTPVNITIRDPKSENRAISWRKDNSDIETLRKFIVKNLRSKFEYFSGNKLEEFDDIDIIENIIIRTNKAFAFPYKNGKIYAYKLEIYFATSKIAQDLAATALTFGVGTKNALGFGFCRKVTK